MAHRNATLVEELYGLVEVGDFAAIAERLVDDVVIDVPGRNPMAGDYKGLEASRSTPSAPSTFLVP